MGNIQRYHNDYSTGGYMPEPDGEAVMWDDVARLVEQNENIHQQANTAIALARVRVVLEMESGLGQTKIDSIMRSMVSVAQQR